VVHFGEWVEEFASLGASGAEVRPGFGVRGRIR
jgi:hypothetical protein